MNVGIFVLIDFVFMLCAIALLVIVIDIPKRDYGENKDFFESIYIWGIIITILIIIAYRIELGIFIGMIFGK